MNHQCRLLSLLRDTHPTTSYPIPEAGNCGGGDRTRTDDPLLAKQVLSQLSYTPSYLEHLSLDLEHLSLEHLREEQWWAREDLNLRPHAYQACALTS